MARPNYYTAFLALLFSVLGILLMSQIPLIWHAKFYLDGHTLLLSNPKLELFAGSYRGTAWVFAPLFDALRYIGVDLNSYSTNFDGNWFVANITWATPYFFATWLLLRKVKFDTDASSVFVLFCALTLFSPFYASINKDIVPALACFVSMYALAKGYAIRATVIFVALCIAYGLTIRSYFLVFALLFLATQSISGNRRLVVLAIIFGTGIVYLAFPYIPRTLIDIGRAEYLEGVSATRIEYFFDDFSALGFTLNRLTSLARIAFPIELILKSPAYLPFVAFRCYASALTLRLMGSRIPKDLRVASSIVFAFTLTQAIFEPDFGSSFRHFLMVMPAVIYLQAGRLRAPRRFRVPRLVLR